MDLLTQLWPIIDQATPLTVLFAAIVVRVSAIATFAPGIGERAVPVRVRLAVVIALSIILTPMMSDKPALIVDTPADLVRIMSAEALCGLVLGFAVRTVVFILQIAGSITAQHLSLSQLFGAGVGFDNESPFATILIMGGIAAAAGAGLHFHLARAVLQAYDVLPIGQFPGAAEAAEWSSQRAGAAFMHALALASPFVLLGFTYSLALAASARAMPQLMAAFVGAPAITLAGLALFAATAGIIISASLLLFDSILLDLLGDLP